MALRPFQGARVWAAAAVVAAVSALHLWAAGEMAEALQLGAHKAGDALRRIEVAFVRELAQAAAPLAAPAAAPAPAVRQRPRPAVPAASAAVRDETPPPAPTPAPAEPVPPAPVEPAPEIPPPLPAVPALDTNLAAAAAAVAQAVASAAQAASVAQAAASPASAAVSASAGPPFEWPPSTRLSYTLTGNYQGPVEGSARVEWLRSGSRYQVHLEVFIGPSFAPLVTRRMSSEGELSEQGLHPQRYEESTKAALRSPRVNRVELGPERMLLANGREEARIAGVQDTASQFVQLTWLFTTQPQRLRIGEAVQMPLALPRRADLWTYDVHAEELLYTPAGRVPTFHLKPRSGSRRAGELLVDTWIAPTLQYLPVRIRIEQDNDTWADLLIDRLPQQAGGSAPAVQRAPTSPPLR